MTILLLMIFMIGSGTLFSMPQAVATDCTGNHVFSDRAPVIADQTFSFREKSDRIEIRLGNQLIASYLKKHSQLTRQGLINVTTQRGIPVTREFPPRPTSFQGARSRGLFLRDADGTGFSTAVGRSAGEVSPVRLLVSLGPSEGRSAWDSIFCC
ncbi:hypothetical protein OAG56_05970 [Mariniblastus sp.]|nr:hypothetical protein [Mariniblastus sp.]MDB4756902.1 hypothetical protein [Mariniblastus sp.]